MAIAATVDVISPIALIDRGWSRRGWEPGSQRWLVVPHKSSKPWASRCDPTPSHNG